MMMMSASTQSFSIRNGSQIVRVQREYKVVQSKLTAAVAAVIVINSLFICYQKERELVCSKDYYNLKSKSAFVEKRVYQ